MRGAPGSFGSVVEKSTWGRRRSSQPGRPQARSPSSPSSDGTSIMRMTVASRRTARARVTPSSVGRDRAGDAEGDEHHDHDERGVGDRPAGAGDAFADGEAGVAGGVAALLDRGEQEQLVVHRQAEEQGEEEQRRPGVDEALVLDAEQRRAVAVLEHEGGEPEAGGDADQVEQDRGHGDQRGCGTRPAAARTPPAMISADGQRRACR